MIRGKRKKPSGVVSKLLEMDDSTVIASVESPQGRTVELTQAKWAYVQRHVEMHGRQDLLLRAIRNPDFQEPDPRPGRERYWFRTQPPFPFAWLRTVVQFEGDIDRVVTAFGQDNDPDSLPK